MHTHIYIYKDIHRCTHTPTFVTKPTYVHSACTFRDSEITLVRQSITLEKSYQNPTPPNAPPSSEQNRNIAVGFVSDYFYADRETR